MLDVFIGHVPADREVAAAIAARLERGAEARVWLDEDARQTVAASWDGGLSSAGILLLLSPDAVPGAGGRTPWEGLLHHVEGNLEPPVATLLVKPCGFPGILGRKLFFRWEPDRTAVLRQLERWVIGLHAQPEHAALAPARLPWFEERSKELQRLWETLVDGNGRVALVSPAPAGKTSLAQEFARQAGAHFRDVLWVDCAGRTRAAIAGDLAAQLGAPLEGPLERGLRHLGSLAAVHRVLLVLDGLEGPLPWEGVAEGLASVLVTGPRAPEGFTAITLEASPPVEVVPPAREPDRRLWNAMAACRPGGFSLALAARIAGLEEQEALDACERLRVSRLVDPFDNIGPRLRLNAASRRAADPLVQRHAACAEGAAELETAIAWALEHDWRLAVSLTRRAVTLLQQGSRTSAAVPLLENLAREADQCGDSAAAEYCAWELSWIEERPVLGVVTGEQLAFDLKTL